MNPTGKNDTAQTMKPRSLDLRLRFPATVCFGMFAVLFTPGWLGCLLALLMWKRGDNTMDDCSSVLTCGTMFVFGSLIALNCRHTKASLLGWGTLLVVW